MSKDKGVWCNGSTQVFKTWVTVSKTVGTGSNPVAPAIMTLFDSKVKLYLSVLNKGENMSDLQNTEITFKITDKDILITNSYLVTDSTAMYKFLQRIMKEPEYSLYGYNRKMSSYIAE